MKKYKLTEAQLTALFEKKKEDRRVVKEISEKFEKIKKNLNEGKHENAMISLLKPYYKKGKINKNVAERLINEGINKKILLSARDKM
jgi:hypothetical protein